jgi:predicted nucleic acid-binding protein
LSKYLLDTNVISELRKTRPRGAVRSWFSALGADDWFLSSIVFGELQAGIELTRDRDPSKAAELEAWLEELLETSNVLPLDAEVCREWARLLQGRSRTLNEDAFVASTASVNGLIVATRNTKDFEFIWSSVVQSIQRGDELTNRPAVAEGS